MSVEVEEKEIEADSLMLASTLDESNSFMYASTPAEAVKNRKRKMSLSEDDDSASTTETDNDSESTEAGKDSDKDSDPELSDWCKTLVLANVRLSKRRVAKAKAQPKKKRQKKTDSETETDEERVDATDKTDDEDSDSDVSPPKRAPKKRVANAERKQRQPHRPRISKLDPEQEEKISLITKIFQQVLGVSFFGIFLVY